MSNLTPQNVKHIAGLAKLQFAETEAKAQLESMASILNYVEQINEVDTSQIEPMANPQNSLQRLRDDEVSEENQRELFQKSAPSTTAGLYLVPQVIESEA